MSKGRGKKYGGPPRGQQPDMGSLAQQIQKMQEEMLRAQEELGHETVEVSAGGGAISVVISGHQHVHSITIDPAVVDPQDVEMLQDLIVAAVNAAIEKSQAMADERLRGLTGGVDIPGLGM
jgi:DNA-binding YbaB/EbfC family protein